MRSNGDNDSDVSSGTLEERFSDEDDLELIHSSQFEVLPKPETTCPTLNTTTVEGTILDESVPQMYN